MPGNEVERDIHRPISGLLHHHLGPPLLTSPPHAHPADAAPPHKVRKQKMKKAVAGFGLHAL